MALAIDATSTAKTGNTGTSYSWSHTCTGTELGLIVVIGSTGDVATAVDYNGVSMTKLGEQQEPDTGHKVGMWYLIAPSTGANNINTTFASGKAVEVRAISFTGAHQSAMVGTFISATYTGAHTNAPTVTVTSATNDIVVDGLVWNQNAEAANETAGAGQTEQGAAASGSFARCAQSTENGAASVVMSWAMSGVTAWAICGVAVKPSGGGGGGGGGSGTVTLDTSSSTTTTNSGTSLSWQHTTAGANRALIVGCSNTSQGYPTGVTYAGVAMTLVTQAQEGNTGKRVSVWKLSNPTLGTNTVTIAFPSAVAGTFGAASFNSCQQTTTSLVRTSGTSTGSTLNPTLTIASNVGDLVFGVVAATANVTSTLGAQQSTLWFDAGASSTIQARASYESGSATVITSFSMSTTADWAISTLSLIPSAASAEAQSGQMVLSMPSWFPRRRLPPGARGANGWMCDESTPVSPAMPPMAISYSFRLPRVLKRSPHIFMRQAGPMPDDVSATPAPTFATAAIDPRISLPPPTLTDEEQWMRQAAAWMAEANQGHLQNIGIITLQANAASTPVTDDRAGYNSFIGFTPRTANASSELNSGNMYIQQPQAAGSFTIVHTNNAQTDRTFTYSILG